VDPVDDIRPSNPASAPELLAALAADFTASGGDLKHLVRVIAGSEAYARSASPLDAATLAADPEIRLWERFRVQPLGPEELREESDDRDYDGTIAQALVLLNGSVVATGASVLPGGALSEIAALPGDDRAKVEALYLRALARQPTQAEAVRWTKFIEDAQATASPAGGSAGATARRAPRPVGPGKPRQPDPLVGLEGRAGAERVGAREHAFEDLLWTLLNSSEFGLNH
jgi:hypothetical protein